MSMRLTVNLSLQELCTIGCSAFVASFNVAEFLFCFLFFLILLSFCSKEPSLKVGEVTYRLFDRVVVKIIVDKSSTENKFLSFSIISKKVLIEDRDRILFHCISKGLNINPKLQTTLSAMFTLWYRILGSFSCHSMDRVWTAPARDRSKSFTHIESFNFDGKILKIANRLKNRATLHSSIKGAVSRNLGKFKLWELSPNQAKHENNCSNIKNESFCRSSTTCYVFASTGSSENFRAPDGIRIHNPPWSTRML